jgi:hypothetical protein
MEKIVKIEPIKHFKLHVWFQDGVNGVVDLSHLHGKPVFQSWENPGGFESVYVDEKSSAPTWPGGVDIDPLNLYLELIGKTYEEYRAFKRSYKNVA